MNITQKKETIRIDDVVIGKKCDYCGAEILPWHWETKNPYYEIVTGHNDWGSDSGESREHTDACSVRCLRLAMDKYYADESNTAYIEIEKRRLR